MFFGKERLEALPLHPILIDQLFMKWGIDLIDPINLNSNAGHKLNLTATDYFTCWIDVALKEANETYVLNFYDDLIYGFGVPSSIISNNALAFMVVHGVNMYS